MSLKLKTEYGKLWVRRNRHGQIIITSEDDGESCTIELDTKQTKELEEWVVRSYVDWRTSL